MSHDKIKAAARRRMTATGEPYAAARRQSIGEHTADRYTSPVTAEDIRAAAAVHSELGPEYSDAVVASFLDRVNREVAARVEARLADRERPKRVKPASRGHQQLTRRVARDVLAAGAGALVALGAVGLYVVTGAPHAGPPASTMATGASAGGAGNSLACSLPPGPRVIMILVRTPRVIDNGRLVIASVCEARQVSTPR